MQYLQKYVVTCSAEIKRMKMDFAKALHILTCMLLIICFFHYVVGNVSPPELVLSFEVLDFDFGSDEKRQEALESKAFIPKNCFLNKIESYRGILYVSTPRGFSGVPFTLVKIAEKDDGSRILEPFPNKDLLAPGDCNAIQMTLAFKIDVNTDTMWILDAGRVLFPDDDDPLRSSFCPAKIVAVKVQPRQEVSRFVFPESVVPKKTNILNDLVLDYVRGELAFIYITDSGSEALVVYDIKKQTSFFIKHSSMSFDPSATVIPFPNGFPPLDFSVGIDGIAMSCDFKYVYYHVFSGYDFHRVPTDVLRTGGTEFNASLETVGRRMHTVDGMIYSTKHNLYYTATNDSAVDRWLINKDSNNQDGSTNITMTTVERVAQNDLQMEFPDAVDINEDGVMFIMANRLNRLFQNILDVSGGNGTNFHIWSVKLEPGERSYLWRARERTAPWSKSTRCDVVSHAQHVFSTTVLCWIISLGSILCPGLFFIIRGVRVFQSITYILVRHCFNPYFNNAVTYLQIMRILGYVYQPLVFMSPSKHLRL